MCIRDSSGDLEIKANDFYVKSYANEKYIRAQADGAVELYHNDIKRLETTASGVNVVGTLFVNGSAIGGGGGGIFG